MRRLLRWAFNGAAVASAVSLVATWALWKHGQWQHEGCWYCLQDSICWHGGRRSVSLTSCDRHFHANLWSEPDNPQLDPELCTPPGLTAGTHLRDSDSLDRGPGLRWLRTPLGVSVQVPHWAFAVAAAGPSAAWVLNVLWKRHDRRPPRPGLCPSCGYDLRVTPDRCPECGTVPARA